MRWVSFQRQSPILLLRTGTGSHSPCTCPVHCIVVVSYYLCFSPLRPGWPPPSAPQHRRRDAAPHAGHKVPWPKDGHRFAHEPRVRGLERPPPLHTPFDHFPSAVTTAGKRARIAETLLQIPPWGTICKSLTSGAIANSRKAKGGRGEPQGQLGGCQAIHPVQIHSVNLFVFLGSGHGELATSRSPEDTQKISRSQGSELSDAPIVPQGDVVVGTTRREDGLHLIPGNARGTATPVGIPVRRWSTRGLQSE